MASVFTRIMRGELPGRIVWEDDACVAFLTHQPIRPGHTLVVTREEIDHWVDVPAPLNARLFSAAQAVGRAIQHAFSPRKVGLAVVGLEVPHVHLHLSPLDAIDELDFSRQDLNPRPEDLDAAAERIRASLKALGDTRVVEAKR